jgi:hypothetical protein
VETEREEGSVGGRNEKKLCERLGKGRKKRDDPLLISALGRPQQHGKVRQESRAAHLCLW